MMLFGFGIQEFKGLKKGVVVNIELIVNVILCVIVEVEMMVGCKVIRVYIGIVGSYIKSKDFNGMVVVCDKEVMQYDVEWVIEVVNVMLILVDDQILYMLVQEFIVDG